MNLELECSFSKINFIKDLLNRHKIKTSAIVRKTTSDQAQVVKQLEREIVNLSQTTGNLLEEKRVLTEENKELSDLNCILTEENEKLSDQNYILSEENEKLTENDQDIEQEWEETPLLGKFLTSLY